MRQWRAKRKAKRMGLTSMIEGVEPLPATEDIGDWISANLIVPTGRLAGEPMQMQPWQRRFLAGAFAPNTDRSILTCGRKIGKSSLLAAIGLSHLAEGSPFNRRYWSGIIISATEDLARQLVGIIIELAEASGIHLEHQKTPKPESLRGAQGAKLEILPGISSLGMAHARAPDWAVIEELGLIPMNAKGRELVASVESATGTTSGRIVYLGTRYNSALFQEYLDAPEHEATYRQVHAAELSDDITDRETWRKALPGLGTIRDEAQFERKLKMALNMGGAVENLFRVHELNQPIDLETSHIVNLGDWQEACVRTMPPKEGLVYLGIDLGAHVSLTSFVAYWPMTGRIDYLIAIPAANPTPSERSKADGISGHYEAMIESGECVAVGERVTDVRAALDIFLERVIGAEAMPFVAKASSDPYRKHELLEAIGGTVMGQWVDWEPRGVGKFAKRTQHWDISSFKRALAEGVLKPLDRRGWTQAIAGSKLREDTAGNLSLDKRKADRKDGIQPRIDLLQAGIIAVGMARMAAQEPPAPRFEVIRPGVGMFAEDYV